MLQPLACFLLLSVFTDLAAGAGYTWPSPQYDTLEGLLYEGRRSDGSSLASIVHPCRRRTGTLASIAAEWSRTAFHDMATHSADNGTGGLDGSIVYELGRQENFSLGFNQTVIDFASYPNKYVSRADVIAMGTVFAVSSCGGPVIPYRGGRIDVYEAGPGGTPEPQHDLATLTEIFRRTGFTQSDMIKLVACGHTFGGVRSTDFPELVSPSTNPGTPHIVDFDTTPQFDNVVVNQYLSGTTQNVLVISSNATMRSDLRIFSSDGNVTMQSLSTSNAYAQECQNILERMLNTVATGTTLTDEIALIPAKVTGAQLTIERGILVFKSTLRLTQAVNATANSNRTVQLLWCDKNGSLQDCHGTTRSAFPAKTVKDDPDISPVIRNLGYYFFNYQFVVPIDGAKSISKFWFQVDEHDGTPPTIYNNEKDFYVWQQDQVFFVPTLSNVTSTSDSTVPQTYTNRNGQNFTKTYNIVAAVKSTSSSSRVYINALDFAASNFAPPWNVTVDLALNPSMPPVAGYSFFSGQVDDYGLQLTVDIYAVINGTTYVDDFESTSLLDNTPYIAPTNVSSNSSLAVKSSSSASFPGRRVNIWMLHLSSLLSLGFASVLMLDLCP